jgi:hypothetical protein
MTGALDPSGQQARADIAGEIAEAQQKVRELETQRAAAVKNRQSTAEIDEELADARRELTATSTIAGGAVRLDRPDELQGAPDWLSGFVNEAGKNPELLFYKLKTNAYKFSWALIPISVPFVWLLFPFSRRFGWYDHTVFVTYSLCFMTLLLILGSTLALVLPSIASLTWLIPPFHMYRQLRGTYELGRFGAIWRTIALTIFAFMAIGLFASLLVGVGEFG